NEDSVLATPTIVLRGHSVAITFAAVHLGSPTVFPTRPGGKSNLTSLGSLAEMRAPLEPSPVVFKAKPVVISACAPAWGEETATNTLPRASPKRAGCSLTVAALPAESPCAAPPPVTLAWLTTLGGIPASALTLIVTTSWSPAATTAGCVQTSTGGVEQPNRSQLFESVCWPASYLSRPEIAVATSPCGKTSLTVIGLPSVASPPTLTAVTI